MKFLSRLRLAGVRWLAGDALAAIFAERLRQVGAEGWTHAHDDKQANRSLALAAALYASPRDDLKVVQATENGVLYCDPWPWDRKWDKRAKHSELRRMEIAGALIVAEMERQGRSEAARLLRYFRRPSPPPVNLFRTPNKPGQSRGSVI